MIILSLFRKVHLFEMTNYQLVPAKLGCLVYGIDLKTENRSEGKYYFCS